jgi:hypothetical protein
MKTIVLVLSLILLTGCTLLPAPGSDLIDSKTVVRLGDPTRPAGNDYVLYIPAGKPVAIRLQVDGALFRGSKQLETAVTLKRDLYIYKYWASYDGRDWSKWNGLAKFEFSAGMGPGGADFRVKVDERQGSG